MPQSVRFYVISDETGEALLTAMENQLANCELAGIKYDRPDAFDKAEGIRQALVIAEHYIHKDKPRT